MLDFLESQKSSTLDYLRSFLDRSSPSLARAGELGEDVTARLLDYSSGGKMIRGALVTLGYGLGGGTQPESVLPIAAAMELTQSFLLIHDDIMDNDDQRRGKPAVHKQYADVAWKRGFQGDNRHYGHAMAICAGDVAFFLALGLIGEAELLPQTYRRLVRQFAEEVALVGVAQMHDVTNGVDTADVAEDRIMRLYRYKTGRYTFSLPLMLGAIAAQADETVIRELGALGEEIGIIFQIKDDEIGIFATDDRSGKPVGSDVTENKKTVLRSRLFAAAPAAERAVLERLFGAPSITGHDLEYIRALLESLGVRVTLQGELEELAANVRSRIAELFPASNRWSELLLELLEYNLSRDR